MFSEDIFRKVIREEVATALEDKIQELLKTRPTPSPKMMTRHQVAKELGIGLSTVDYWTRTGRLTKVQVGKRAVRFERARIEELIKNRKKDRIV